MHVLGSSIRLFNGVKAGGGHRVPVQTAANKSFDIYKPSQSYAKALLKFV